MQLFVFLTNNNNNNDNTITHNVFKTNRQTVHCVQPLSVFTAASMSAITSKFTIDEKSPTNIRFLTNNSTFHLIVFNICCNHMSLSDVLMFIKNKDVTPTPDQKMERNADGNVVTHFNIFSSTVQ